MKVSTEAFEEINYKLDILSTEEDLQESYNITESEVNDLIKRLNASFHCDVPLELTDTESKCIIGELENSLEIAEDQKEFYKQENDARNLNNQKKFIKQLKATIKHLKGNPTHV